MNYLFILKVKIKSSLAKSVTTNSFVNQPFEHYKTYQCYHFKSDDCELWVNILFSLRQ